MKPAASVPTFGPAYGGMTTDRVGCARITGQEVVTALIGQLLADPDLSAQIIRTLRSRR